MKSAQAAAMPDTPEKLAPIEERIRIGMVLDGKYRIEQAVGSGGMGLVVSASHLTMGHRVAIKLLRLEDENDPPAAISRFVREARATARIESEHVVRVSDVAALPDGTPYMVMELLDGDDLRHMLSERHQLPIAEAVGYMLQACEGLATAHAAGVVHRDLKPSNLFLARRPNGTSVLKVLDFGISKLEKRAGEAAMTTTSSLMGSPLYMAPEQMRSSRDVDLRADVWSLGLILSELLAGEPPFIGETIPEICLAVMSNEPHPISLYRNDIPQALQAIVLRCLAKSPSDRYASMGELARALEPFAEGGHQVHADRASAAVKSARRGIPAVVIAAEKTQKTEMAAALPPAPPRLRSVPEALPSWAAAPKEKSASRRNAWIGLIAGATVLSALVAFLTVRALSSGPAVASSTPSPTAASSRPPNSSPAVAPVAKVEVASVPFDSLPRAAVDAGITPVARAALAPPRATAAPASTSPVGPNACATSATGGLRQGLEMGRSKLKALTASAVVLALALAPQIARAQALQSAQDKAAAEAAFEDGKRLMAAHEYADACLKLAESQRLDPGLGTMLGLADCFEKNGQTASSWAEFKEAAAVAARKGDKRESLARENASRLEPLLSKLIVRVSPEADVRGLALRRDGVDLGRASWGEAVPVDPGVHTVAASAPGKSDWQSTIEIPARPGALTMTVPTLALAPVVAAPPPQDAPPNVPPASPSPPEGDPGRTQRIAAVATGGAGVIAVVVGSVLGLSAKSKLNDSNANGHCDAADTCDPTGLGLRSDAKSAALGSTIFFVIGGAAIAGGAVLWFTAPHGPSDAAGAKVGLAPAPGGLSMVGSW